jgi:hypothetical protein
MAVNCCVAPTATVRVDDVTETDVSVLGGGMVWLEPPPHPVYAITSGRKKRQVGIESEKRRRVDTCV